MLRRLRVTAKVPHLLHKFVGPRNASLCYSIPCRLLEHLAALAGETPAAFFQDTLATFEAGARYCCARLAAIDGLACPAAPQGAMYLMARVDLDRFPGLADDVACSSSSGS